VAVLHAAPVVALAVGTKYAAGLCLPTLVVLAALVALPHRGRWSIVRRRGMESVVAAAVRGSGRYRPLGTVPFGEDQGRYRIRVSRYRIWVKR
jgi:hypothetical protein